jgi:hypothetical protein
MTTADLALERAVPSTSTALYAACMCPALRVLVHVRAVALDRRPCRNEIRPLDDSYGSGVPVRVVHNRSFIAGLQPPSIKCPVLDLKQSQER